MLHRQFKDALLTVDVAIPSEGESVASNVIILHEGRKASGGEVQIQFPKLLNLAAGKRIRAWLEHSDSDDRESVDGLGRPGFPGGVNPPDDPSKPPKRDPKPDPKNPKEPDTPKEDPEPKDPENGADSTSTWERALNVGLAVVTGPQLAATAQYLAVPVDIKKFIRAVVSVDKDAGNNTGLVSVSLVF